MNASILKEAVRYFLDSEDIGIVTYALIKEGEGLVVKKLDIESLSQNELLEFYKNSLNDIIIANDNLSVIKLSSADERLNAIYEYDLEIPHKLKSIDDLVLNHEIPPFNFRNDNFSNIKSLLIEIGNDEKRILLYKSIAPINIFGRKGFFLHKSNERLEQIKDDFFRLSSNFQFFKLEGKIFIVEIDYLEKSFGIHDIIKAEAIKGVDVIKDLNIINNPAVLDELIEDISFARKLIKVAKSSPIISLGIPNNNIIAFAKKHPALKEKFNYSIDDSKFNLDTQVSKNLFIKLLNDDYLNSALTKLYYDSIAKDKVHIPEEVE